MGQVANAATRLPKTADDWNDLWIARQAEHSLARDADYWNERARTFTNKDNPGSYTERFLQLAGVREGESVLDMGCGTGNLSIPLALAGHDVLSADFSEAMLARLTEAAEDKGSRNVRTMQLSWSDDWEAAGIAKGSYDMCFASRSINTDDLRDSLRKLTSVARRRCCITLPSGASPHVDGRLLREIGIGCQPSYDSIYALAILQAEGYQPELTYIDTLREDTFASFDDALAKHLKMTQFIAEQGMCGKSEAEVERLVADWLHERLTPVELPDGNSAFALSEARHVTWAFVSWDVR